tara:strand:- start:204 stop:1544 length:1341 start_codon:yes stop_codon:yes gene_type:complete
MIKTNIKFINHASVLISHGDIKILSDPWYTGPVFHNGWRLLHEIEEKKILNILKEVTHIFISHEHPDHFNTSFFLNQDIKDILIKKNIEILFQYTKDKRVFNFLNKNGFNIREYKSNEKIDLGKALQAKIIKHDFYDSSLILETPDLKILNLNDCPMREVQQIKKFKKKHGPFDVLLTQFSYAAWKGGKNNKVYREKAAEEKLETIEKQATILNCKSIIPFASFVYFSNELNFYMNDSINTPETITKRFLNKKFNVVFLSPDEIQEIDNLKQKQSSIDFWVEKYNSINSLPKDKFEKSINFEDLVTGHNKYISKIEKKNSKFLIRFLKKIKLMNLFQSINIKLYDHNKTYSYSIFSGLKESSNGEHDVSMHSQSLAFIFKNEFGFDTLTVNGCFECSQDGFSKLAKTFALGSLNALGLSLNLSLLTKPQIVFLFLFKLKKVLSKLI